MHFKLYSTVNELPNSWDDLAVNDIFLSKKMLSGMEVSYPENISVYYVGFFKEDQLVGIAILQRVKMYIESIFRDNTSLISQQMTSLISKIAKGNILVLGNLKHTGQHGFYFNTNAYTYQEFLDCTYQAIEKLTLQIKSEYGKTIRLIAFKDYFLDDSIHDEQAFFKQKKLYQVQVQPNMIFPLQASWTNLLDYKSSLKKKYKQRLNAALKKKQGISVKQLSLSDLKANEESVFKLYKSVSDNAGVNSFVLAKNHFYELKKALEDDFIVVGYFLEDTLIGFFTLIHNTSALETYFLGYNSDLNHKHQLYLNMLYDMVDYGITNQYNSIVFARTAMEIKSSVGAKPNPMVLYVKHTNHTIANVILKGIVKYLNPLKEWQERQPFK